MSDRTQEGTVKAIASIIGEGVHASLRKYCDSHASARAWTAIHEMPDGEWADVCRVVAEEIARLDASETRELPDPDAKWPPVLDALWRLAADGMAGQEDADTIVSAQEYVWARLDAPCSDCETNRRRMLDAERKLENARASLLHETMARAPVESREPDGWTTEAGLAQLRERGNLVIHRSREGPSYTVPVCIGSPSATKAMHTSADVGRNTFPVAAVDRSPTDPDTYDLPAPSEREADRPEIVCLCGSTRFKAEYTARMAEETLAGRIVLSVGLFGHADGVDLTDNVKAALDELHLRKIDLADRVVVICPGGYIGESTAREITYAESLGKPIERDERSAPDPEPVEGPHRRGHAPTEPDPHPRS